MTLLHKSFNPSPEDTIARVRELSEGWHSPRRILRCIPTKKSNERFVKVFQPWKKGKQFDFTFKNENRHRNFRGGKHKKMLPAKPQLP